MKRAYCLMATVWMLVVSGAVHGAPLASLPEAGELEALVDRLGHGESAIREEAQRRLAEYSDAFPRFMLTRLADLYGQKENVEIRFRLRQVMKPLVRRHLVGRPPGFMGVHLEAVTLDDGTPGIRLAHVQEGKGADRAGLRAGDVVLAAGDRPMSEIGGVSGFSDLVAGQLPGSLLELVVLRDGKQFRESVPLVIREEWLREGGAEADDRVDAWFQALDGNADPDFPVGHFPQD